MHATTFTSRLRRLCSASHGVLSRRWRLLLLLLLVLLFGVVMPSPAFANFLVYPLITSLDAADEADTRISVYSKAGITQFIRARVVRVDDPATPHEHEVVVEPTDSRDILVLPRRLVVPAGAVRSVRVLLQKPPGSEATYRVYFESVAEFDDDKPATETTEATVSFNIAFGATVRVLPVEKRATLSLAPSRDALANTGNMRIGVMRVGRCKQSANDDGCEWTYLKRSVFPGQTWPLPWRADDRRVVATIRTTDDPKERDVVLP